MELKGKPLAEKILQDLQKKVKAEGFQPCLAVILVGEDPASLVYVNKKITTCEKYGFRSLKKEVPKDVKQEEVLNLIEDLNQDPNVDGILLQLPLPPHLKEDPLLDAISYYKDVDGLTAHQAGLLVQKRHSIAPCTPSGIISLLKEYDIPIEGKKAVVIGRSKIVGLPMFLLLQQEGATVTLCHSKTPNVKDYTRDADIVVVAAGREKFFGKDYFHSESVVIDVGIHRLENKKLCGDVNAEEIKGFVKAYTPVPGGVGPLTIATLLQNTYILSKKRRTT